MFDIAPTELLIVGVVALLVIGPKDLPKAMRFVGNWMGKARRMAAHFRAGVDNMVREAELEDLKKEWEEQNRRIMEQFPNADDMSPAMREGNPGFPEGQGPEEQGHTGDTPVITDKVVADDKAHNAIAPVDIATNDKGAA